MAPLFAFKKSIDRKHQAIYIDHVLIFGSALGILCNNIKMKNAMQFYLCDELNDITIQ